jgi:hypothetical protein
MQKMLIDTIDSQNLNIWGRLYKTLNHFFNHYFVVK